MSIGKVLGFLGLTSDVTGFGIEQPILAVGLALSIIIQLLKDYAELDVTDKDGNVRKVKLQTLSETRKL